MYTIKSNGKKKEMILVVAEGKRTSFTPHKPWHSETAAILYPQNSDAEALLNPDIQRQQPSYTPTFRDSSHFKLQHSETAAISNPALRDRGHLKLYHSETAAILNLNIQRHQPSKTTTFRDISHCKPQHSQKADILKHNIHRQQASQTTAIGNMSTAVAILNPLIQKHQSSKTPAFIVLKHLMMNVQI